MYCSNGTSVHLWRRLALYVSIMLLRGFVLYQGMNQVEDHLIRSIPDTCWYRSWLRQNQPDCYGRIFDFSDHIVLFFAQILPIALVECLDAWRIPPASVIMQTSGSTTAFNCHRLLQSCSRVMILLFTVYLYVITLPGAFKTTAYFHTGAEMLAGYAVSLAIQLPLYHLQCGFLVANYEFWFGSDQHRHAAISVVS